MNKYKLYWFCQIVGWGLNALLQIFLYYSINDQFDENQIFIEILRMVYNILLTHLFRKILVNTGLLRYKWLKLIPIITISVLVMGASNFLALEAFTSLWDPESVSSSLLEISGGLIEPTFFYSLWSVIYFTFHYFERYNKSLQYEAAINEFEINNLKAQLNPHFIFNALNSIRALVDENPNKSKTAITRLSNILRSSLILDKKKLISFKDELTTVKDYLELESIRYEERLQFDFNVASESFDFNVPPMMIQTIAENGIKHGVSKLTAGGAISVKTQVINHTLLIQIRNSGQYKGKNNDTGTGFGLKNTIKRLHLIYGEEASFKIVNENSDTVLTEIVIPETI